MAPSISDSNRQTAPSETGVTGRFLDGGRERAFLVGVDGLVDHGAWPVAASVDALARLVETAGAEVAGQTMLHIRRPTAATLIGKGQLNNVIQQARAHEADLIALDVDLHPRQQRNIETAFGGKILDRTGIILDIFAARAQTVEGRLQVERAQLEYLLPRLSNLWVQFSRQRGGIGPFRGPGETQIETDRRLYRDRIATLNNRLDKVRNRRADRRKRRREAGLLTAAIIGYTNAGKSSLLNALSGSKANVENQLFATLDPTTRKVVLPGGGTMLVTDTVGFIQRLPTRLIQAFRATLEEALTAEILIHVVDLSSPHFYHQVEVVEKTLGEIGVDRRPVVTALNKIDIVPNPDLTDLPNAVAVSAKSGEGISELLSRLADINHNHAVDIEVEIPYTASELVALFHARGNVQAESFGPAGTRLRGAIPDVLVSKFDPYRVRHKLRERRP